MRAIKSSVCLVARAPDFTIPHCAVDTSLPIVERIETRDVLHNWWLSTRKKTFLRMLSEGHYGMKLVLPDNREIIGYGWIAVNGLKPIHIPQVPSDVAWLHYVRIRNGYQGRGYYKILLTERIKFIRSMWPDKEIYVDTSIENIPARRAQKRLGFQEVGIYRVVSIGTARVPWLYWQWGKWVRDEKHPPLP